MDENYKERAEVLGGLIKDAREHARRSPADCAQILNCSIEAYEAMERGESFVSLPDLEALAIFLKIPMGYFWGSDPLDDLGKIDYTSLVTLRNRVLGATLRQRRLKARKTTKHLAKAADIDVKTVERYESGMESIPYLHLEPMSKALELSINDFVESSVGPLNRHEAEQQLLKSYRRMPPEMKAFLLQPVNIPYLDAAKLLSEMEVEKLRQLAENLLDITF